MNLALKEANENMCWLILIKETEYLKEDEFKSVYADAEELVKLLASIVKTTKMELHK